MARIELSEETLRRLDELRVEDETYDEVITELINIYQAEERSMATGPDESG